MMLFLQLVAATSPTSVTVSVFLASPSQRIVVDHYTRTNSGVYRLVFDSQDLLRYLAFTAKATVTMSTLPLDTSPPSKDTGRQSTDKVLMVAPTAFGFNEEAAKDNHFMHAAAGVGRESEEPSVVEQVTREFAMLHHQLEEVEGALHCATCMPAR
jgi:hypothetical protein